MVVSSKDSLKMRRVIELRELIEMGCLKPKVRSSTVMEETHEHLPDIEILLMVHLMFYLYMERNGIFLIMKVFFIISRRHPSSTENIWRTYLKKKQNKLYGLFRNPGYCVLDIYNIYKSHQLTSPSFPWITFQNFI